MHGKQKQMFPPFQRKEEKHNNRKIMNRARHFTEKYEEQMVGIVSEMGSSSFLSFT